MGGSELVREMDHWIMHAPALFACSPHVHVTGVHIPAQTQASAKLPLQPASKYGQLSKPATAIPCRR
jgi:hypothetical protein